MSSWVNKCPLKRGAASRKRKPRRSGAFVGKGNLPLLAQTAGHASVAVVAHEAVARARLIPENVRFVAAKVVADDGVVGGLRASAVVVRIRRDHDPARDRGWPRGDVAREVVARNLHLLRAEKRDADPREIPVQLRGSTRARIVLDLVTVHLQANYGFIKSERFDHHASAVIADRVSGEGAAVGDLEEDAPRPARDPVADDRADVAGPFRPEDGDARFTGAAYVVGDDLGAGRTEDKHAGCCAVRDVVGEDLGPGRVDEDHAKQVVYEIIPHDRSARTGLHNDACGVGFRDAYNMVLRDSAVDAQAKGNPFSAIACDTVSHNSSVASSGNVDHERVLVLEAPEREAGNAHISHALVDLAGFEVEVAEDANSRRSVSLRAGRVCLGSWGGFDHGVFPAQLYPVLADEYVLSVNSPDHDRVARIGSVDGLLDGLARPNDLVCRLRRADRRRQGHPTCHQHGQRHGGHKQYGAPHKETAFLQGAG